MKMLAIVGATLVPMAVPRICLYILPAKENILCCTIIFRQLCKDFLGKPSSGKWVKK